MYRNRFNLRKVVAIAICLVGFSVSNVLAQNEKTDKGVVINGVKWATRNVDKPGTFVANPEDFGMLYQWNRRVGWSVTDPMINSDGGTDWDSTIPEGTMWKKSNDPSPVGWRVPTSGEIYKLLDTEKVTNEWTTLNGVNGRKFTDRISGKSIFLPAVGCRDGHGNGSLYGVGSISDYWSSTHTKSEYGDGAFSLSLHKNGVWNIGGLPNGFSVRPVAD